jgi:hypothetical protein
VRCICGVIYLSHEWTCDEGAKLSELDSVWRAAIRGSEGVVGEKLDGGGGDTGTETIYHL